MKLNISLDFWFDGIDDCIDEEIKDYLKTALSYGAESSCSEIEDIHIEIE